MDGLMLGFIARELSAALAGARVDRVMQPEKDELHLTFFGPGGSKRLLLCASPSCARAHLTAESKPNPQEPPMFCMLLRKLLAGGRVMEVRQPGSDRILEIEFSCVDELGERVRRILSCEIMGRHSNIILYNEADGRIADAIRHVGADVSRVREVKPGLPYTPPPSQGKLDPATASVDALRAALASGAARLDKALAETIAGLGALSAREFAFRLTAQDAPHIADPEARAALAVPLRALLDALPSFAAAGIDEIGHDGNSPWRRGFEESDTVREFRQESSPRIHATLGISPGNPAFGPPVLLLSDTGEAVDALPFAYHSLDPSLQRPMPEGSSAAMDALHRLRDRRERMVQKASSLARSVRAHIERCENKLAIHEQTLADTQSPEEARVRGELLTAALHLVERGASEAIVPDYYTGGTRAIPLDTRLTPAQNAQKYYKQYQKARTAQAHAAEQAEAARAELSFLTAQEDDLRKCQDTAELDEIRQELVRAGYLRPTHGKGKPKKPAPSKPMVFTSADGITIRVGKNSQQNDRLTAAAAPDAVWLHAKNMAGSHVVIDHPGEPPEPTLREAALLAAWFSRGYRSAQVPVDYTERRNVKKPAGAAPGFVTYTRQRTLYITPDEVAVKRLTGEVLA